MFFYNENSIPLTPHAKATELDLCFKYSTMKALRKHAPICHFRLPAVVNYLLPNSFPSLLCPLPLSFCWHTRDWYRWSNTFIQVKIRQWRLETGISYKSKHKSVPRNICTTCWSRPSKNVTGWLIETDRQKRTNRKVIPVCQLAYAGEPWWPHTTFLGCSFQTMQNQNSNRPNSSIFTLTTAIKLIKWDCWQLKLEYLYSIRLYSCFKYIMSVTNLYTCCKS